MKRLLPALLGLALLAGSGTAYANDYISENPNDWFRYEDSRTGDTKRSEMQYDGGGWRLWSNFAGLGEMWIYTESSHDYFWIWDGSTYQFVANLSGNTGSGTRTNIPPCNRGTAMIGERGSITTPAGTFTNAVRLDLSTSCADAGVTSIWFAKGVGVVKWSEQSFAGERTYELAAASVDGKALPTAPVTPAPSGKAVAVSEHATMENILWGCNDTYLVVPTYRDAFKALEGTGVRSQVIVSSQSVASQLQYEMAQANVPMGNVDILVANLDSVWMRDYGPIILKKPDGTRVVADPDYYPGRPVDDRFPISYANYRGWDRVHVQLSFEGGNFATDGRGMAMISNGVKWFNRSLSTRDIERQMEKMGCTRTVFFEPLIDEGTTHIDMFARIMNDNTALVSRYPSSHRQHAVTNEAAARMQSLGYNVIRVNAAHTYDEFATYSNSVLANGVALVPVYGKSTDAAALDAYRQAGYRAVGIDSKLIIKYSGATHCLSMQIPAGN